LGTFNEHIKQSRKNLLFYSALHLINAHIAKKTGNNYLSHKTVDTAINPYNDLSVSKLDEETYVSYITLFNLSRRSRYLLNESGKTNDAIQTACATYSVHLKKAVRHLEVIIDFIKNDYNETFPKTEIKCIDLKGADFKNFDIIH